MTISNERGSEPGPHVQRWALPFGNAPVKVASVTRGEALAVAALLVVFVWLNCWLSLRMQPVWLDEVTVADPAVNLLLGRGFTSTGWQYQTRTEFWASNAPLHQILLYHWMKLFGFVPVSVRSLNFALIGGAVSLLWAAVARLRILTSVSSRFAMVALMLCSAGVTFNYTSGRYDCIGILLCCAAFFALSVEQRELRWSILVASAAFVPFAGINLIPYTFLLCVLAGVFCTFGQLKAELYAQGLGLVLGGVFLYFLYSTNGVAHVIVVSAGGHGLHDVVDKGVQVTHQDAAAKAIWTLLHLPIMLLRRLESLPHWYLGDLSYIGMLVAHIVCAIQERREKGSFSWRTPIGFGLAVAISVPFTLGMLRNYPFYYGWMALIPMAVTSATALSRLKLLPLPARGLVIASLGFALLHGLPLHLLEMARNPAALDVAYYRTRDFVNSNVTTEDRAYADFEPYYALVQRAQYTLLPPYRDMLTQRDREELTVLVIHQQSYDEVMAMLGGTWKPVAHLCEATPYDLVVYRRRLPSEPLGAPPPCLSTAL